MTREVVDGEETVVVTFRLWHPVYLVLVVFLAVWLCSWSSGSAAFVRELAGRPFEWSFLLKAVPVFGPLLVVPAILATVVFGHTRVTFSRSQCTAFTGIGRIGRARRLPLTPMCRVRTDWHRVSRGRGGSATYYRLLLEYPSCPTGPRVLYESTDSGLIAVLRDLAADVQSGEAFAGAERSAEGPRGEPADMSGETPGDELRDRTLLAGQPPRQLKIARDMEGKIAVSCSSGSMAAAFVFLVAVGGIGTAIFLSGKWSRFPLPAIIFMGFIALFPVTSFVYALFGRRTLVLDHGQGEAFSGVAGIGRRTRFVYGPGLKVSLADTNIVSNGRSLHAIEVAQPEGGAVRLCTTWSEEAKPYLAALLRHPECAVIAPSF